jgi:hypothetical protein
MSGNTQFARFPVAASFSGEAIEASANRLSDMWSCVACAATLYAASTAGSRSEPLPGLRRRNAQLPRPRGGGRLATVAEQVQTPTEAICSKETGRSRSVITRRKW